MKSLLIQQYEWIKGSRAELHQYCRAISQEHFVKPVEGFGRGGSIRNLLVHITNTYNYWVETHCMQKPQVFTEYHLIGSMAECEKLYERVDEMVWTFIDAFEQDYHRSMSSPAATASPLKVFSHVTTHEFHHKGQVLTMSRILGYTPIDTDVIR